MNKAIESLLKKEMQVKDFMRQKEYHDSHKH